MKFNKKCYSVLCLLSILSTCKAKLQSRTFGKCFFTEPQCPNQNITFHFYSREFQDKPVELNIGKPKTIYKAKFIKNRPLIVLLHGYTGHKDFAPNTQLRPAYFRKDNFNIISVDYKPLALEPCYYWATFNLATVANCTAQLLDYLIDEHFFKLESIHVIGFSLGK